MFRYQLSFSFTLRKIGSDNQFYCMSSHVKDRMNYNVVYSGQLIGKKTVHMKILDFIYSQYTAAFSYDTINEVYSLTRNYSGKIILVCIYSELIQAYNLNKIEFYFSYIFFMTVINLYSQ